MMTDQRIGSYVTAEPFRPFHIQMAGGSTIDIRHPEILQVGRTTMTTFSFMSSDPGQTNERQVEISLRLIESVEPLDVAVPAQGA
jgi:hypothetical protein